ncbi:hypothetical protein K488DRAFT_85787 [Vararia minispora EC-137]|uniref:Uncharacterized protein n=1 Tax=Vararia minispora EC-137 TaxID=1314806 RepID=A0ACB8QKY1_9AGAM|nr:hypothetical protein K488DRAFT_85787 [Vararia minispora EC-137]
MKPIALSLLVLALVTIAVAAPLNFRLGLAAVGPLTEKRMGGGGGGGETDWKRMGGGGGGGETDWKRMGGGAGGGETDW